MAWGRDDDFVDHSPHPKSTLVWQFVQSIGVFTLLSVTEKNSDIGKINQGSGEPVSVSAETAQPLCYALDMAQQTGGVVDPTISPVISEWGFISGAYRIPTQSELAALLQKVNYKAVHLDGNGQKTGLYPFFPLSQRMGNGVMPY